MHRIIHVSLMNCSLLPANTKHTKTHWFWEFVNDKAVGQSGQWTHHQTSLWCSLINFFLYANRSAYQLLTAWQLPVMGLHYLVSLLICIVDRNVWINLCPRGKFGVLCSPAAISLFLKFHSKIRFPAFGNDHIYSDLEKKNLILTWK